jgi:hypothetical protein
MSVALTEQAVRDRRKTVTRRAGWSWLTPGTDLELCRKVMGRRRPDGTVDPLERLALVRVTHIDQQPLNSIDDADVHREGFTSAELADYGIDPLHVAPGQLAAAIVRFFVEHMGGTPDQTVTRIEWRYLT